MKLQYRLSNGNWINCENRTEEFLSRCENQNGVNADSKIVPACIAARTLTRDEVSAALAAGKQLRNAPDDWYSECRDGEAIERIRAEKLAKLPPVEMVKCSCGHTIPRSSVMSASMGSSCPNCYDRMSY